MRHTFASAHLEDALGRTAGELIDGEMGVLKALGRFFEECRERGIAGGVSVGTRPSNLDGISENDDVNGDLKSDGSIHGHPSLAGASSHDGGLSAQYAPHLPPHHHLPPHLHAPHLSPLEKLFITPGGLQITLPPGAPAAALTQTSEDGTVTTANGVLTLSVEHQKEALYRGMDALVSLSFVILLLFSGAKPCLTE